MRFVLAIISFVLGVLLVGLGVGQRTVFAPPKTTVASVATKGAAPVTVIPGSTLTANAGYQRVRVTGGTSAFAAYGRSEDVQAWVGSAKHNTVRWNADTQKLHARVSGSKTTVPDPKGSDLWSQEWRGKSLDFTVRLPADTSIIVVGSGKSAAPSSLSVTWPRDTATPLLGPLMTAGGFFVLLGIAFLVWAVTHQRRGRGPRRRSGGGKPPRVRGSRRAAEAGAQVPLTGRSQGHRRMVVAIPVLVAGTLVLTGCSAEYWPQGSAATATPSATASATAKADAAEPTAATRAQITRVVDRVASVAQKADSARDADLAATRFSGPALALRKANYTIRGTDTDVSAPPEIPTGSVSVALPQQTDAWPRTVFAVVSDSSKADVAPQALTLVQQSPRSEYTVQYDVSLEADAKLPSVAPASIGAARLSPDVKLLRMSPGELAGAYGDILSKDSASEYASLFSADGDDLRTKLGKAYKDKKTQTLQGSAKIEFSSEEPDDSSIALATNNAGALVMTDLNEIEKVTPTEDGATLNTEGAVKALSGLDSSKKGVTATYGVQLLFSVPPVGSKSKIELLGFTQGLIAASEVQ